MKEISSRSRRGDRCGRILGGSASCNRPRGAYLSEFGMVTYAEKLKDPRWQKKRLEVLETAQFKCIRCGSGNKFLHVHHGYYSRDLEPWDYPDSSLWSLCEECHGHVHRVGEAMRVAVGHLSPAMLEHCYGYVMTVAARERGVEPQTELPIGFTDGSLNGSLVAGLCWGTHGHGNGVLETIHNIARKEGD